jgi:aryl-phospho-beta-D-glucosidase BglC (GH1 family)
MFNRLTWLCFLILVSNACTDRTPAAEPAAGNRPPLPAAQADQLPRWRGFNLQEKFYLSRQQKPFLEEDFRLIAQLGFNFVRLPMDYRVWIRDDDWTQFDEGVLREIDQAVQWGGDYGIHVMINFHRAPGYTVARPPEPRELWTDPEAQRVCALHWATFARRYRGIPNERLSFNLFNEPSRIEPDVYLAVCRKIVSAIRAEDPDRLIVADGIDWASRPVPELQSLEIAQATRGYQPMEISHYRASWVNSTHYREPRWPRTVAYGLLLGPAKTEPKGPLVIEGPFDEDTRLRLRVMTVSHRADLVVDADGQRIWEKSFVCGAGEGEWKKAEFKPQWGVYQNLFDRDYRLTVPQGTRRLEVKIVAGDWLQVGEIGLQSNKPESREHTLALDLTWGEKPAAIRYTPSAASSPFTGPEIQGREWLRREHVAPWVELRDQGVGVMVGEFGAYNKTPHDIVLRWMEDSLANWQQAEFGWALWNFRGTFGILDSRREDVEYEEFEGHQLDRKMLELLQKY